MSQYDLIVIGGGPAGLSAALSACRAGLKRVLVLERRARLGGILMQCIHIGFGFRQFGEELTGPEYALRLIEQLKQQGPEYRCGATVLRIKPEKAVCWADEFGLHEARAHAVILSSGCRERPIGALNITGTRPAGIFTAGSAQEMLNIAGYEIGDTVAILGSGDVGMIVARRLTLLGKKVIAVIERSGVCGGLLRNRTQCLEAFGIPLRLCESVTCIHGRQRISGISVCPVDTYGEIDHSHEVFLHCDTLIVSTGLICECDLLHGLPPLPWLFVCGNARKVFNLVEDVARDGEWTGRAAAHYIYTGIRLAKESAKQYQWKNECEDAIICLLCPQECVLRLSEDKVIGAHCEKGAVYGRSQLAHTAQILTATVKTRNSMQKRLSIKTSIPVAPEECPQVMRCLENIVIEGPVRAGETIKLELRKNLKLIATDNLE